MADFDTSQFDVVQDWLSTWDGPPPITVGLYARISEDPNDTRLGVIRQLEDGLAIANQHRWRVGGLYVDNDLTAFKAHVVRPEFERLLADIKSGEHVQGAVCYDQDRFVRQPKDLERVIDIYETAMKKRHGLRVLATGQGDINLHTDDGITSARFNVAMANKSSRDTARRVTRKHVELADKGVSAGGFRPFGWTEVPVQVPGTLRVRLDRRALDSFEASLIRTAVDDVISGMTIGFIADRWNAAGVTTPRGNAWTRNAVKALLLSPRIAGYRVFHKELAINSVTGQPVRADFAPIIDDEKWQELQLAVNANRARGGPADALRGKTAAKYMLSGLAQCGICGATLSGARLGDDQSHGFMYMCRAKSAGGCGQIGVIGPPVDELVTQVVLGRLKELRVAPPTEDFAWTREGELTAAEERREALMAQFANGTLGAEVVFPTASALSQQIKTLRDEKAALVRQSMESVSTMTDVVDEWPELDAMQRRQVVRQMTTAVVVKPATRRGSFDPTRVVIALRS